MATRKQLHARRIWWSGACFDVFQPWHNLSAAPLFPTERSYNHPRSIDLDDAWNAAAQNLKASTPTWERRFDGAGTAAGIGPAADFSVIRFTIL